MQGLVAGKIEWIAVQWGSPHLRFWAMDQVSVLAKAETDLGEGTLSSEEFERVFLAIAGDWLPADRKIPVIASGVMQVAGCRAVPCTPVQASGLLRLAMKDPRVAVFVTPGLKQDRPADLMQGEETKIAGALSLYRDFDGVICLPGPQTKWAQISAGEVVSFQSFMTGELFSFVSQTPGFPHGLAREVWEEGAFDQGFSDAMARPERLAARLSSLRAEVLLQDLSAGSAGARLSGLLIGAEVAAAKPYWLGQNLVLIGDDDWLPPYQRAFQTLGLVANTLSAEACALAGLSTLARDVISGKAA